MKNWFKEVVDWLQLTSESAILKQLILQLKQAQEHPKQLRNEQVMIKTNSMSLSPLLTLYTVSLRFTHPHPHPYPFTIYPLQFPHPHPYLKG